MIRPGRKSASYLAAPPVDGGQPRLQPPSFLTNDEQALFTELVEACAPQHFVKSDEPLLVAYVQAILVSRQAVRDAGKDDTAALSLWEKSTKLAASLATRLRLSPQSRAEPKSVARHLPSALPRPWVE